MIRLENISFDQCIKCTVCTIYCPVARVTHLFPGPKQSGPDTERLRIKDPLLVDASLKYCSNCKRCETVCPSGVQIASIIQEAKWNYVKRGFFRPRDFFMSRTDLVGSIATKLSAIVNFLLGFPPVKIFMDLLLKIPSRSVFPSYANGTFAGKFRKLRGDQARYEKRVTYFHGCFVNYNDHALGMDLVTVLNAMNIGVEITREKCCGVPLIANGYIEKAKQNAIHNIRNLSALKAATGSKIVSTSSSCSYALKHEYSHFLSLDNGSIYDDVEYITKFLFDQFEAGNIPDLKPVPLRVAYHSPCHLERLGGVIYTINILKRIPGLDLVILHSECCGIAGTYGFKKEYHSISTDIASQLVRLIERANPEFVVTDCETCNLQISSHTDYRVLHPINLLAQSIAGK
ncbi:MAG: anaerobic glycerol-3-phosphate dehydrogenase subunit C [Spirochaetes bacterium]|nr:anaerobic glycerol-3-phosphate dehydrogenase subunit C [Spirochaetota bacterium]